MKTTMALVFLLMCATSLRADDPPVVAVRFIVEAGQFVEKLAETGSQPAVEAAVAEVIEDFIVDPFRGVGQCRES